jgi:hypothetical protein
MKPIKPKPGEKITRDGVYDLTMDELANERWLPVVGFVGQYEVSDLGRVRSLDRAETYERSGKTIRRRHRGRVLQPGTMASGHLIVILGQGNNALVHQLVLGAFVGPRPDHAESLHGDGVPGNNRLPNLRWGTRSENMQDAVRHGTHRSGAAKGERSPRALLSDADVFAIRAALKTRSQREVAADYGVSKSTIGKISSGKNWSHLAGAA